jgi:RNA polymerase sigma factor (sigma-70 family)
MVLSVCRRALDDPHDADDAFQATFLVLVRNARSVRHRESVGGWLLGIARRVAKRARVDAARRGRQRDELVSDLSRSDFHQSHLPEALQADFGPLLEEVHRLPDRFRAPILLHYFEGLSAEATAKRLQVPRGTVLSRLARARARLRARLELRGFSLDSLLPSALMAYPIKSGLVVVPARLIEATIESATCLALAGASLESVAPTVAAALARQVGRALLMVKVRAGAGFLSVAMAGVSLGWAVAGPDERDAGGVPAKAPSVTGAAEAAVEVKGAARAEGRPPLMAHGRVLGPDRKPLGGAEIFLHPLPKRNDWLSASPARLGVTKRDGSFEVAIPRALFDPIILSNKRIARTVDLSAFVPGFGPAWINLSVEKADKALTLVLRRGDVPIEGRVVDEHERPLSGARVRAVRIMVPSRNGWDSWSTVGSLSLGDDGPIKAVHTDRDGKFRFSDIGSNLGVMLVIDGPEIETMQVTAATNPHWAVGPVKIHPINKHREVLGPKFEVTAWPGRAIEGVVRNLDTRQPVKDADIQRFFGLIQTKTDAEGRFRITGYAGKDRQPRVGISVSNEAYFPVSVTLNEHSFRAPATIWIHKGVWVEGRVVDKSDGKPVRASVRYFAHRDNPHLKELPDATFDYERGGQDGSVDTDELGHFRIVALPGDGLLTVRTMENAYVEAAPISGENAGNVGHMNLNYLYTSNAGTGGNLLLWMWHCQALVPIDVHARESMEISDIGVVRREGNAVK